LRAGVAAVQAAAASAEAMPVAAARVAGDWARAESAVPAGVVWAASVAEVLAVSVAEAGAWGARRRSPLRAS